MKYIKEYNTNRIENLSDYLQEFFDKFNIKQIYKDTRISGIKDHLPCWVMFEDKLQIDVYVDPIHDKVILQHLYIIRGILERRMNEGVYLRHYRDRDHTRIKIILHK